jgi:TIR domain
MKTYLSYAWPDQDLAKELYDGLQKAGHEVWFDEYELDSGYAWGRRIDNALKTSQAMIVLISPDAMNSKEVRREIAYALVTQNFAFRVLPVYVKPTYHAHGYLKKLKGVRVGADHRKAIRQVKAALGRFEKQLKLKVEHSPSPARL